MKTVFVEVTGIAPKLINRFKEDDEIPKTVQKLTYGPVRWGAVR